MKEKVSTAQEGKEEEEEVCEHSVSNGYSFSSFQFGYPTHSDTQSAQSQSKTGVCVSMNEYTGDGSGGIA